MVLFKFEWKGLVGMCLRSPLFLFVFTDCGQFFGGSKATMNSSLFVLRAVKCGV